MRSSFERDADLRYAQDLLNRINKIRLVGEGTKTLGDKVLFEKYAAWQFFQQSIFGECRSFSRFKKHVPRKNNHLSFWKSVAARLVAFMVTFFGVLRLIFIRPKAIIFSIDKCSDETQKFDFRMSKIFHFFEKTNIPYGQLLHTTFDKSFLKNILKRGIAPVLYLESFSPFSPKKVSVKIREQDLSGFDDHEKLFVEDLVIRYVSLIARTEKRVRHLAFLFKFLKPKAVFLMDDYRNMFDVLLSAEFASVPSYVFQHGHFAKYNVGSFKNPLVKGAVPEPTVFFVWSDYWKQEYARLGGVFHADLIKVSGTPTSHKELSSLDREFSSKTKVLIPYETESYKNRLQECLELLKACPNIELLFKVRPDVSIEKQCSEYGITYPNSSIRVGQHNDLLLDADVVIGSYTSFLYDAIAYEKPVLVLETGSDYGEGLLVNNLAASLSLKSADICKEIMVAAKMPKDILSDRRKKLTHPVVSFDEVIAPLLHPENK